MTNNPPDGFYLGRSQNAKNTIKQSKQLNYNNLIEEYKNYINDKTHSFDDFCNQFNLTPKQAIYKLKYSNLINNINYKICKKCG